MGCVGKLLVTDSGEKQECLAECWGHEPDQAAPGAQKALFLDSHFSCETQICGSAQTWSRAIFLQCLLKSQPQWVGGYVLMINCHSGVNVLSRDLISALAACGGWFLREPW